MHDWLRRLDVLLRARNLRLSSDPDQPRRRQAFALVLLLGGTYGFFMGWYALKTSGMEGLAQLASATVKTPLLFLLTLGVTFPSLYVFNTLLGSRLTFGETTRILAGWLAVILAVAASLGPILGFFTISTESYPFMVLLNVMLLGLAGVVGCAYLIRVLRRADEEGDTKPTRDASDVVSKTLVLWIVLFGVVGLQMAWVLRPFIGAPDHDFAVLRPTQSNVFESLAGVVGHLMGIDE